MIPKLRSASLLKPLYAWAAGPSEYAKDSVSKSSNSATDELITQAGGLKEILLRIKSLTKVEWAPSDTWGRVLINAKETLQAYKSLQESKESWAKEVITYLQQTDKEQTLGLLNFWEQSGYESAGIKLGWDILPDETRLRTHAVIVTKNRVRVCLTATKISAEEKRLWFKYQDEGRNQELLNMHKIAIPALCKGLGITKK